MIMSCVGRVTGRPVRRLQDVVAREHQDAGLGLRLDAQREVDGHLVTVEVGVERRADERVQLDRLALDACGSKAWMPRRCSVGARLSSTGRSR